MPQTAPSTSNHTQYDRCLFLVFNHNSKCKLDRLESMLIDGAINKWRRTHQDPNAERIDFIYVDPADMIDPSELSEADLDKRHVKYSPLRHLTSRSHLYLIGHHEINDNRLEVSDEANEAAGEVYHYFDVKEVANLLLRYLTHETLAIPRDQFAQQPDAYMRYQRLMISVAMCNTAVGMLIDGKRDPLNSFSAELARELYNQEADIVLNSTLSGSKAWVYITPGQPSVRNLVKLLFSSVDKICQDPQFRHSIHKRYVSSISLFGKYHEATPPMTDHNGKYKRYFDIKFGTTGQGVAKQAIDVDCIEGVEWYQNKKQLLSS